MGQVTVGSCTEPFGSALLRRTVAEPDPTLESSLLIGPT
jgi:hypothetical protein